MSSVENWIVKVISSFLLSLVKCGSIIFISSLLYFLFTILFIWSNIAPDITPWSKLRKLPNIFISADKLPTDELLEDENEGAENEGAENEGAENEGAENDGILFIPFANVGNPKLDIFFFQVLSNIISCSSNLASILFSICNNFL